MVLVAGLALVSIRDLNVRLHLRRGHIDVLLVLRGGLLSGQDGSNLTRALGGQDLRLSLIIVHLVLCTADIRAAPEYHFTCSPVNDKY